MERQVVEESRPIGGVKRKEKGEGRSTPHINSPISSNQNLEK